MNKEILFRGKCIEDNCDERGKWVYGYLVYCHDEYEFDKPRVAEIIETDAARLYTGEYNYWKAHEVDPETVGQWTGRIDRNGNKVFEGDILKMHYHDVTDWSKIGGYVDFDTNDQAYIIKLTNIHIYDEFGNYGLEEYYEVIGNIWDNPEMLGGKDE